MNTVTLHFRAEGQKLIPLDGIYKYASNTVEYIRAVFDLGENWTDFDVVRAAWFTDYDCIVTVLDQNGVCVVPAEVLNKRAEVCVNLFGCDVEEDELVDRLTTYPIKAVLIDANARVCGSETAPVTPSQFEQFIAIVEETVHSVKDIDHTELNADYTLTIYYTDGTSDTVGPIRGEQGPVGPTGNGISKIEKVGTAGLVDTYRITYTNGQTYEYTVTNGAQGPQGNGIVSIYKSGESGAVKTYTILFTDGNTFEYNVTDGEVTFATLEQLMPKDTASGAIASFPDGQAVFPLKSCVVDIEPVQAGSGTPSPDNVRPITGWTGCEVVQCGKNLFDKASVQFANGLISSDGSVVANAGYKHTDSYIKVNPSTAYVFSGNLISQTTYNSVAFYDSDKQFISRFLPPVATPAAFTTPNNCEYIRFNVGSTDYNPDTIQLEEGSTATPYTPYNGTTYNITWQTEAGTVYGGTVDVVTGELIATMPSSASVDMGALNGWRKHSTLPNTFWIDIADGVPAPSTSAVANIMCSAYQTVSRDAQTNNLVDFSVSYIVAGGNVNRLYVIDSRYGSYTAEQFATAVSGIQLVYELATPTTYQLDPVQVACLLGQNNVWADCGAVAVRYIADIQGYIDKKTS